MGCILCCNNKQNHNKEAEIPKIAEFSWDQRKKLDPKDFTIENYNNCSVGRMPGSINGEQFIIQNCKNTRIYLLDHIGTISIDDCTHCDIIIGPVKTSLFIRDSSHCNIMVACQQFRTRDCHHLNIFLSCTSQPIIESSTKIKVAPYQLFYPQLSSQFKSAHLSPFNCNWSDIHDFTPVSDQNSNFGHLNEDLRPFRILTHPASVLNADVDKYKGDEGLETDFSKEVNNLEITDVKEQSVVPYTLGNRRIMGSTEAVDVLSLVIILYDDLQHKIAHDLICYVTQNNCGMFLIKTRETKLSLETSKLIFGPSVISNDPLMSGAIVSLEYAGSSSINELIAQFKVQYTGEGDTDSLVYVSPDPVTSKQQIDLINNVSKMGMSMA